VFINGVSAVTEVRLVAEAFDRLGEGPCWAEAEGRLYWFDIKGSKLHWHDPAGGGCGAWPRPWRASAAAPRARGGLLLATERGLAFFDTRTGEAELRQPMDLGEGFRSNDGVILGDGCFWWSSMDDDGGRRPGVIFRTCPDGFTEPVIEGVHIANSLAMSPDGARLYLADSLKRTIWAYDAADLSKREVFATVERGGPDGSCVDAEGFLWNAEWGAWRVVRRAPDGRIDRVLEMPVEQPSACMFGGPGLATLYVTSAWEDLSAEARARQPLAGCLFAFEPGVKGLPLPAFEA
jgi:sugar lactone lactonase YvrE